MPIRIGILKETAPGERRVALVPETAKRFADAGATIAMERGAGNPAGFPDSAYYNIEWQDDATDVISNADVLLTVQPPTAEVTRKLSRDSVVIGFLQPHAQDELIETMLEGNLTSFSVELIPRISRAQSMDALSSQAVAAGYKAVLIAANTLDQFLPMLTTAAGTIRPSTVLVIGAGVAGLQAIATAKRLGAVVEGYDVRSATREQIESLGGRFVDTGVSAEGEGGYARELTEEEKQQQQQVLADHIAKADAVVTTAAIPGRPAPKIISADVVERMKPGAVIVDLAAESGGNCELTQAGKTIEHNGVRIVGPLNLPSEMARHASEMYARNLLNFLKPAIEDGQLNIDWNDEVFAESVLTHAGEIRHAATKERIERGGGK
ncbi:MAG: NAD(P) transhydrogenase subunit alpha [Gammaproteobacteria bacterium]